MVSVKTLTCCTGLFFQRISSVSTEQSQSGVESSLEQILERLIRAYPKVLEGHPEELKSSTKNSSPWLTFRDYRQFRETECFRTWKIFESMPLISKIEFLRTAAKFYHPIEEGNDYITTIFERRWMEKTHINVQRIHGAQKSERFKTTLID